MLDRLRADQMHQPTSEPRSTRNYRNQNVIPIERPHDRNRFDLQAELSIRHLRCRFQRRSDRRACTPIPDVHLGCFAIERLVAVLQPAAHNDALVTAFRFHTNKPCALFRKDRLGQVLDRRVAELRDFFRQLRNADDSLVDRHAQPLFQKVAYVLRQQFYIGSGRNQQMYFAWMPVHVFANKRTQNRWQFAQYRLSRLFGMDTFHSVQ